MDSLMEFLPLLGTGLLVTLLLTVISIVCGSTIGLAFAYVRRKNIKLVTAFVVLFTDLFRCVPPIAILFILYYGLPFSSGGITLSAFAASWLGLSLIFAATSGEVFRTCMESMARGGESMPGVPQILRGSAPDLMLQAIETVKHTALASFIVVPELFYTAKVWNASTLSGTPYLVAGLIYFLLLWPVLRISDRQRLGASHRG
jgi:polar amino acid transport system permease protein